jgi:predicted secreted protein
MKPLRPVLAAIVTAALLVPATASAHPATLASAQQTRSSQTMTLDQGQKLSLTLLECDSCGYSWKSEVKPDPRILTRRPTVTRDGRRILRYVARARGTTTLTLAFQGPAGTEPVQRYTLTVKVR